MSFDAVFVGAEYEENLSIRMLTASVRQKGWTAKIIAGQGLDPVSDLELQKMSRRRLIFFIMKKGQGYFAFMMIHGSSQILRSRGKGWERYHKNSKKEEQGKLQLSQNADLML